MLVISSVTSCHRGSGFSAVGRVGLVALLLLFFFIVVSHHQDLFIIIIVIVVVVIVTFPAPHTPNETTDRSKSLPPKGPLLGIQIILGKPVELFAIVDDYLRLKGRRTDVTDVALVAACAVLSKGYICFLCRRNSVFITALDQPSNRDTPQRSRLLRIELECPDAVAAPFVVIGFHLQDPAWFVWTRRAFENKRRSKGLSWMLMLMFSRSFLSLSLSLSPLARHDDTMSSSISFFTSLRLGQR